MKTVLITVIGSSLHALVATVISLVVGLPGAYCLARYKFTGSTIIIMFCVIAAMMPTKLIASSLVLAGSNGGSLSIIYAFCIVNIPFVISVLSGIIAHADRTLEELARDAGATWYQAMRSVVVPTIWPSLCSIAGLIFVLCFSNSSIPLILARTPWQRTCDMMIYDAQRYDAYHLCAIYTAVRVFVKGVILYWCTLSGLRSVSYTMHSVRIYRTTLQHTRWWLLYWFGIAVLIARPWMIVYRSFGCIIRGAHAIPCIPLYNSMYVAGMSSIGAILIGTVLLLRTTKRNRSVIIGVTMIPFLLGSVSCSIACIIGVRCGWYSPCFAAILGYTFVYYPYVYRILSARMAAYNAQWHELARSYGASVWDIYRDITIPFLRSGLLVSWCSVYVLGFSDVGMSVVLADEGWITIPALIREYAAQQDHDALWILYGYTVLSIIMLWCALWFLWYVVDRFLIFLRWAVAYVSRQDVYFLSGYFLRQ